MAMKKLLSYNYLKKVNEGNTIKEFFYGLIQTEDKLMTRWLKTKIYQ